MICLTPPLEEVLNQQMILPLAHQVDLRFLRLESRTTLVFFLMMIHIWLGI